MQNAFYNLKFLKINDVFFTFVINSLKVESLIFKRIGKVDPSDIKVYLSCLQIFLFGIRLYLWCSNSMRNLCACLQCKLNYMVISQNLLKFHECGLQIFMICFHYLRCYFFCVEEIKHIHEAILGLATMALNNALIHLETLKCKVMSH